MYLISTSHPKITRILDFPHLFRIALQGYLRGCLQATVLSKALKKLNSQVFLCAIIFFPKLTLGLFPISPRLGGALYPSQSSADGDSPAELYLTHFEPFQDVPSRCVEGAVLLRFLTYFQ